jgi:hypothetical protein
MKEKQQAILKDVFIMGDVAFGKVVQHPKFFPGEDVRTSTVTAKQYRNEKLISFETLNTFYTVQD